MKVRVHVDIEDAVISRIQELTRMTIKEFIEKTLNQDYNEVIQLLVTNQYGN